MFLFRQSVFGIRNNSFCKRIFIQMFLPELVPPDRFHPLATPEEYIQFMQRAIESSLLSIGKIIFLFHLSRY